MASMRRLPWIIGWRPPPSMKKTTDLAPRKTPSSWGHPPATKTGSMPGISPRHSTSSFVPALYSCSPGPWLGRPAIRTIFVPAACAGTTVPSQARAQIPNRPNGFFMRRTSTGSGWRGGRGGWAGPTLLRSGDGVGAGRSDQLGLAGDGDRRDGEWAEFEPLGRQFQLRVERLLPGDGLARVGRHPAHDGRQGALGDGLQLVERSAVANARDQVGVLLVVGVHVRAAVPPGVRTADAPVLRRGVPGPRPLGAGDMLGDVVLAAVDLAAHAQDVDALGIFVVDREVVEDVAVGRAGADLAAAHADGADRVGVERPVDHVEVVDVLLADVVAREPGEVEPVAELPFHVAPARLAGLHPEAPLVPEAAARGDLADRAVAESSHALDVAGLVLALGAGDDGQVLRLGLLVRLEDLADPGAVRADRLLGEDVLAGLDRGGDVQRPEAGRGGQDHQVHAGVNHFLEGVEADEAAVGGDVELVAEVAVLEVVLGGVEPVLEQVAHGVELHVRARVDRIFGRGGAASATADQADLDGVAAGRVHVRPGAQAGRRRGPDRRDRRGLEEVTPRGGRGPRCRGLGHGCSLP